MLLAAVGVFLASTFLFSVAYAAEEAQLDAAVKDLITATGQQLTSHEEAKALCNQEQYFDICAEVGKRHGLYTEEEKKQVDSFLAEVKGTILADIKSCTTEECLVRVAGELAQKIQKKNPDLANNFKITSTIVAEKQAVVDAAKEAGVDFKTCESMNPDTAAVELLRKCARLAKDARVQKYIPEERRASAGQFGDTTIKLREALTAGKYQCGDGTLEGCGNFCLKPSADTQTAGIPEVCRKIATEVFGAEGVKELEKAHQQVGQVKDYYSKKFILTLPDGRELAGEGEIRNACDRAFSTRNIEVARACGSFAVQNGFASQAQVEKGLKLMESFAQKGQNTNFDQCISNPTSCRDFISEEDRGSFDAGNQIFEIMRAEIGFDPSQCERGAADPAIGAKCFEGSKRALAKIEGLGLANQSREAGFIIEDIKRHIQDGDEFSKKKDQFRQAFQQEGGPGGCRSEQECYAYCSDQSHGPECISFGSKQGISGFRGQEAVDKFQEYNQNIQRQFPGQGPFPGFQPPGQGGLPPGQIPGFNQPGPGFGGPVGPSPECFAAIQSGDFVKAKTVCDNHAENFPTRTTPICPATPYVECPAGQYHESFRNNDGCWIDGPCKPAPTYSSGPYPTSTQFSDPATDCKKAGGTWKEASRFCEFLQPSGTPYPGDANSCPGFAYSRYDDKGVRYCYLNEGGGCQYNYPAYLDKTNYSFANCPFSSPGASPYPTYSTDPSGWINKTWKFKDSSTQFSSVLNRTDSEYTTFINGVYNDCSGKYFAGWKPGGGDQSNWREFGIPVCSDTLSTSFSPYPTTSGGPYPTYSYGSSSCSSSLINLLGSGCHQMYSDSSGRNIYCDGPMTKSAKEGDTATTAGCSGGTYPTYSYSPYPTTSSPTSSSCPSGSHTMGSYCMSDGDASKCGSFNSTSVSSFGACSSYTGTTTYSPYPTFTYTPYPTTSTSSGSCPSGSHSMGSYCMSDADGTKCGPYGSTSVSGFGSCDSYTPTYTTYTPYPTTSTTSCGTGYYWDSATNACKSTCPSTQYWNGSSCVDNTTSTPYPTTETTYTPYPTTEGTPYPTTSYQSCPSGQYWDGSACVQGTSMLYDHYMAMGCLQRDRVWNGAKCEASGLFAKIYEGFLANTLKLFGF